MHPEHHPLDLRYLGAGQRHRASNREDRRRYLVLPDRQLRLRSRARARHRGGRGQEWRQGAGPVRHPFPATDFSLFLLQAQASKAKIIGLANAGADTVNSIKQASEFGIVRGGQKLAALLAFITDVHALGLQTSQGLIMTEAWYWDLNDANREFAKKFAPQNKGIYPTMVHAGVYSAVTHYLKAVEALKSDADGKAVSPRWRSCRWTTSCSARARCAPTAARSTQCTWSRRRHRGIQGPVGLLQGPRHYPRRRGVPPAVGRRLPAREQVNH